MTNQERIENENAEDMLITMERIDSRLSKLVKVQTENNSYLKAIYNEITKHKPNHRESKSKVKQVN